MSVERVPTFLLPENPPFKKIKSEGKNKKKQKTGVLSKKNQRRTAREWWRGKKYLKQLGTDAK